MRTERRLAADPRTRNLLPAFPNIPLPSGWISGFPASIVIQDKNASPGFRRVQVVIQATINGQCHYDWEDVDFSTNPVLHFNGNGANWSDGCWRGDLLHR
jgi:hypothetical protein